MKDKVNSYEDTKKMLNVIRNINENIKSSKTKIILEQLENQNNNTLNINGVDIKLLFTDSMDKELTIEQKETISNLIDSFKNEVAQLVNFEPGISINEKQARFDGVIEDYDIKFTYISGDESGVYINAEMFELNNEIIILLDKLYKFSVTYKQTFDNILSFRQNN